MTVCITTFKHRFDTYFKPLLAQIKAIAPDIEVIVLINGENKEKFDETFRKKMLLFLADYTNVFPVFFPEFRGLSKLWNTGLIHSTSNEVLLLNDDLTIYNHNLFRSIHQIYEAGYQESFKINGSWSHVVLNKQHIVDMDLWFNEKLLGIGEEDGFFEWKYEMARKTQFKSYNIGGITNHVDMSHNPTNTVTVPQGKYSKLNGEVMLSDIFEYDEENGVQLGMYPHPVVIRETTPQYPNEKFFRENRDRL